MNQELKNEILKIDSTVDFSDKNWREKFVKKVDWHYISICKELSEDFIREFKDKVDWYWLSNSQKLSEDFIREFKDKVNWGHISNNQKLFEDFIREFKDKVDWGRISNSQKLSEDFIREFNLKIPENNWLYVTTEQKRAYLLENHANMFFEGGGYELTEDSIIAYKGVRLDGYSTFNFQYHYEVGNEYESHCNCSLEEENSFGLSAWTLEKARNHCSEKIFKVEIKLQDLGAIVHGGGKLRAFKLKILEEI